MADASIVTSMSCLGTFYYPRTDKWCDYIKSVLPADPCQGETLQGRCEGNIAVYCADNNVIRDDCAAAGNTCGQGTDGNFRCQQQSSDPCLGETFNGRCENNYTALWCENGQINRVECQEGTICMIQSDGTSRCVDKCPAIGRIGICENNIAYWCENETVLYRDCNICNQICDYVDDNMGYYCK
jgi:hypothetical protein